MIQQLPIFCQIHGVEEYQGANTDEQQQARMSIFCQLCAEKKQQSEFQVEFIKESIIPQFYKQIKKNQETMNILFNKLIEAKQQTNIMIDELINFVRNSTETIKIKEENLKNLLQSQQASSLEYFEKQHLNYKKDLDEFKSCLLNKLCMLVQQIQRVRIEAIEKDFDSFQIMQIMEDPQAKDNCYKLIKQQTLKQVEHCQAMAFNMDNTIVALGCEKKLFFFKFIDKLLIQDIEFKMEGRIVYLKFITQNLNQLLSVVENEAVYIWEQNPKKIFTIKQKQIICSVSTTCIDQLSQWLVFGSPLGELDIWRQTENEWCVNQIITDLGFIQSVSLNHSCTKLISGGKNKKISIFQRHDNESEFILSQLINVQSDVQRIKFFGDRFMFYEPKTNQLIIYNLQDSKFKKENEKKLQGNGKDISFFPIYQSRNGFAVKHSNYLSFLNYSPIKNLFEINQQMIFQNEKFQGCLSDNREYLIIWDDSSKQCQVRQWMKLNK